MRKLVIKKNRENNKRDKVTTILLNKKKAEVKKGIWRPTICTINTAHM